MWPLNGVHRYHDNSSESDEWQEEEECRDNFIFSGNGGEEGNTVNGGEEEQVDGGVNVLKEVSNDQIDHRAVIMESSYVRGSTNNVDRRNSGEGFMRSNPRGKSQECQQGSKSSNNLSLISMLKETDLLANDTGPVFLLGCLGESNSKEQGLSLEHIQHSHGLETTPINIELP